MSSLISSPKLLIVIPARYQSSRLPGKPLVSIGGKPLIERTYNRAKEAVSSLDPKIQAQVAVAVATDDDRIYHPLADQQIPVVMTDKHCKSGTERLIDCYQQLNCDCAAINLQGDAPFIPSSVLSEMIQLLLYKDKVKEVLTCAHPLSWQELDWLKEHKKQAPFSGTCVTADPSQRALWFSKNIIPSLRHEEQLRSTNPRSPVLKHLGIYGFQKKALEKMQTLSTSYYESLEELEQLRWLESGMHIHLHTVILNDPIESLGIDSPSDVETANQWLKNGTL